MSIVVVIVAWLIRNASLKVRQQLVMHILDSAQAIALSAIIDINEEGEIVVSGRSLDIEKASQLRVHARTALDNKALNLIKEQVKYETYVGAATKAANADDLTFYRAALWWGQTEDKYLKLLAGRDEPTVDL